MFKEICYKTSEYYDFFIPPNRDDRMKRIRKMVLSDTIFDCSNARIEKETENSKTTPVYQKLSRCAFSVYRYAAVALLVTKFIEKVVLTDKIADCVYNIPFNKNIKTLYELISLVTFIPFLPLAMVIPNNYMDHIYAPLKEEFQYRFLFQNILGKMQNGLKKVSPNFTNRRIFSYICSPSFCTITTTAYFAFSHLTRAKTTAEQRFTLARSISLFVYPDMTLQYQHFDNLAYPMLTHFGINISLKFLSKHPNLCLTVFLSYFNYLFLLIVLPYRNTEVQQDEPA